MLTVFVTYRYFLGLRTLTVIENAVNLVNKRLGKGALNIDAIDYDDKKVFELISSGKTEGIFQLESAGMKNFIKELKPENLEDIIAGISLYRPGPMDFIPKYIKGKNNRSSITYDCKELEPILAPTYGCIVYQEQVMQIVRDLAGYSYGRSDLVRRAMSKKKASVMEKERKNFVYGNPEEEVKGCIANGISEAVANRIYDEMIDFAKYAFNKSHAAAYAVVAYQTAYLKCYYPVEYMAALLTSVLDNVNKVSEYSLHCRQIGIEILPPDINEGEGNFSVSGNNIRYGLSAIKGLGRPMMDAIVAEREALGRFTSLKDFATRLSNKEVNKRTIENFIKAGAMDSLPGTRKQKMVVYGAILDGVIQEKKKNMEGQMSLFDFVSDDQKEKYEIAMPDIGEYDKEQLLSFEKEVLGIYISGHPLEDHKAMLEKNITNTTLDFALDEETGQTKVKEGQQVVLGGMIAGKSVKSTRTNAMMAFITLEDLVGTTEVIIFPRDYEANKSLLELDSKVFICGKATVEEEKAGKVICQKIIPFSMVPKELWVKFSNKEDFIRNEQKLYDLLKESDGNDGICIYLEKEKAVKHLPKSKNVKISEELLQKLYAIFSQENIRVLEKSIEK